MSMLTVTAPQMEGLMKNTLHICNGDAAVAIMRQAGIEGTILPWRDVLHDGPVPDELDLFELSRVRAKYISDVGWGRFEEILASFHERDEQVLGANRFSKISLWFEHDLYDQLQVLQILDTLAGQELNSTLVTMACSDHYLGKMSPEQMSQFGALQAPVNSEQYVLARRAWSAYRQASPELWTGLLGQNLRALPFLYDAVKRTMQEFPDGRSGVSRSERQALSIIQGGETRPGYVFGESQKREERIFMGDSSFWLMMNRMIEADSALLSLNHGSLGNPLDPTQSLSLTDLGEKVLSGEVRWLDYHQPDYYIGGVHFCRESLWCYYAEMVALVRL